METIGPTLAELGDADLLVVWAMRRWLTARRNGEPVETALATPFDLAGMPDGPALIDDLMSRVAASVSRPMAFGCLHCGVVRPDENQMLAILRVLQTRRIRVGLELLCETVACAAVASVCDAAQRLVDRLADAGLSLARRATLHAVPIDESKQRAHSR